LNAQIRLLVRNQQEKSNFLFFYEGDMVKIGDTLAIIEHDKLDLQILQAKALKKGILAQIKMLKKGVRKEDQNLANQSLIQAEANYEVAKTNNSRMTTLFESKTIRRCKFGL